MGNTSQDPVDHARTTRQHAGESMKNGANAPGILLVALAIVAMVLGLAAFASGSPVPGTVCLAMAVIVGISGGLWLRSAHRRVRNRELRRAAEHPSADAPPPTS